MPRLYVNSLSRKVILIWLVGNHIHEEIFTLKRFNGTARGKEWEFIVLPIIMRYAMHAAYYCPPLATA